MALYAKSQDPKNEDALKLLRKAFVPHRIAEGKAVLVGEDAAALAFTLGWGTPRLKEPVQAASVLDC